MVNHGTVKSTVRPNELVIDESSVWVHSNITPVEEDNGEETFVGFEYDMVQYDKDEYINIISNKQNLIQQALDELILGGSL